MNIDAIAGPGSFSEELAKIETLAARPFANARELADALTLIYASVAEADLSKYDTAEVTQSAPEMMNALFAFRLKLRDQIPYWHSKGFMTHEAQKALRDVLRVTRYASDIFAEIAAGHPRLEAGHSPLHAFTGTHVNTHINPRFKDGDLSDFKSGDVLLVRGMLHNSAAIARIGDIDSQFSHVGLVYIDDKGKRWMVEALIEEGAVITPLEKSLGHGLGRAILLRSKDADLASRAAKAIHKRVRRSLGWFGRTILYDFTMRPTGYVELFCSKLVRQAYDRASEGLVILPTFTTRLDMKNRDFFQRIGVDTLETFAPADTEIEPRFDLVAEWRDVRVTSDLRLQDMVMTKFFEWMETHDYRFRPTFVIHLISVFGRLSAHLSETAKNLIAAVVPKVPINMRRRTIAAIAMLHKTAEPVFEDLKKREAARIAATGRPMHPREVLAALEEVRMKSAGTIGYLKGKHEAPLAVATSERAAA